MYETKFGPIKQYHIRATLSKKKTRVLALLMFYETRADNPKKYFKVLSCVIYTIIKNYVFIYYLAWQSNKLSEINAGSVRRSKHGDKKIDNILGIGIPFLLMNIMSYRGFLKKINSVV